MSKKVIVVGDVKVGKDTLIHRIRSDTFISTYTVGVEVHSLDVEVKKITIWNCAGDSRYARLGNEY